MPVEYEDRITIPTPEGVELELTLAGLGSRAVSGGIDLVLKAVATLAMVVVIIALLGDAGVFVLVPVAALTLLLYDVGFETLGHGRTPGKRWIGLRVVRAGGRPVDARASVVRNVVRLVDGLPLSYVPTVVSILVTSRNQRPGDLAADTLVVRDRPSGADADAWQAARSRAVDPAVGDVSAVPAADVATVRAFLERRSGLGTEVRARLAAQLDGALRPQVGGADEPDPERFLEILYDAKRARG